LGEVIYDFCFSDNPKLEAAKEVRKGLERLKEEVNKEAKKRQKGERTLLPGIPYNRLYGYYDLASLIAALSCAGGLPLSLKFNKKEKRHLSPEPPSGDISRLSMAKALAGIRRKDLLHENEVVARSPDYQPGEGALICDCKAAKDIPNAFALAFYQDRNGFGEKFQRTHKPWWKRAVMPEPKTTRAIIEIICAGLKEDGYAVSYDLIFDLMAKHIGSHWIDESPSVAHRIPEDLRLKRLGESAVY